MMDGLRRRQKAERFGMPRVRERERADSCMVVRCSS
jgi:hypothetical protein